MSKQTYTPTHCPQTGRKFTKAERKAANKAKYAAERAKAQAERVASKPKSKRKAKAQKASPKPATVSVPTSKAKLMRMTKAQLVEIIVGSEAPASEPAPKRKSKTKRKPTQAVKKPRRNSADGVEQSQARKHTANKVGKAVKTKVVHAITEGEAQPFEPRKEVIVPERKAVKRAQMRVTLLPGETPEEGIRRMKIQQAQAEAEAHMLEAEGLLAQED